MKCLHPLECCETQRCDDNNNNPLGGPSDRVPHYMIDDSICCEMYTLAHKQSSLNWLQAPLRKVCAPSSYLCGPHHPQTRIQKPEPLGKATPKTARSRSHVVTKCTAPHHSTAGISSLQDTECVEHTMTRMIHIGQTDVHRQTRRPSRRNRAECSSPFASLEHLEHLHLSPAPQARHNASSSTSSVCMKNDKTRPPGEGPSYLPLNSRGRMLDVQRLQRAALLQLLHAVPQLPLQPHQRLLLRYYGPQHLHMRRHSRHQLHCRSSCRGIPISTPASD